MIGIIVAFRKEVERYLKDTGFRVVERDGALRFHLSPGADGVVIVEGGIGKTGAQAASEKLLDRYYVDFVVSVGFAGGVSPGVELGDLYLCDRLLAVEGPAAVWDPASVLELSIPVDPNVEDQLNKRGKRFVRGSCLSVPHLIPTTSMKRWIGETFSTNIIDMESYWVAEVAADRGIPIGVARCVLDAVDHTIPEFVGGIVNNGRDFGIDNAIWYMAQHPFETPKLINMALQAKTAGNSLSGLVSNLIDCLTPHLATTGRAGLRHG